MANLATLKPFKKGYDPRRNIKGRVKTKDRTFKELLLKAMKEKPFEGINQTLDELLLQVLIKKALAGDYKFYKLFMDYRFGKPKKMLMPWEEKTLDYSFYNLPNDLDPSVFEDSEVNNLLEKHEIELKSLLFDKGFIE